LSPRQTSSPLSKLSKFRKFNRTSLRAALAVAAATTTIGGVASATLSGPASAGTGSPAAARPAASARPAHPAAPAARMLAAPARVPERPPGKAPVQRVHHRRPANSCGYTGLRQWICQAETIMVQHGVPRSAVSASAATIVVMHESGGNPHASNGWDANAAAGTPSEGIAQTIAPTFNAYALPGHHNIWNPVDNMIAAFRYAISRYGSMNNIPGVVSVRSGGSYVGY
jgi:hypothetical protein